MWSDGYEEVAVLHTYLTQVADRGRVAHFGEHVVVGAEVSQALLALVQQTDFHVFAAQQLCQVRAYFTGTCNNDSHSPSLSSFNI